MHIVSQTYPFFNSSQGATDMKAMVLNRLCNLKEERQPLALQDMPEPGPADQRDSG
jgi:hypothetical protein